MCRPVYIHIYICDRGRGSFSLGGLSNVEDLSDPPTGSTVQKNHVPATVTKVQ
jgi:hypothetical protein